MTLALLLLTLPTDAPAATSDPAATGTAATGTADARVAAELLLRGIDPTGRDQWTEAARDRLAKDDFAALDAALAASAPSETAVAERVRELATALEQRQQSLSDLLTAAGTDRATLRQAIRTRLAFEAAARERVTEQAIRDEFDRHRRWYDGTTATVRQRIGDAPSVDAPASDADPVTVRGLRSMPLAVAQAVFAAEPGRTLDAVRSPLGWHRVSVDTITPGDRSREDSRKDVITMLRRQLRAELIAR